jgi:beta-glucuronidase
MPRYAGRRGVAAYRLDVPVAPGRRHQLCLDSVQFWSRIYVDSQVVAEQPVGYSPVRATFTPGQATARIVVLMDNRFHQRNPLQFAGYDWYQFGGIDREATLHELPDAWIEHVWVQTVDVATARVKVHIRASGASGPDRPLYIHCRGGTLYRGPLRETIELRLPQAALWSPRRPVLHPLVVELGDDDWREMIGLRDIRCEHGNLLLNGQPLRLRGVNYHYAHPQTGSAISDHTLLCDLQLIRDMGCNFIRVAHYPPDHRLLELCDGMGLLVWAECLGWGLREVELRHSNVVRAALANLDTLAQVVASHPSVIIAGFFNECASDAAGARPIFEQMAARLRELLPDRLISYATNKPAMDLFLDLVDVVAWNTYPGWYHGSLESIEGDIQREAAALRARPGAAGKPVMISELGAEALRGHRDWHNDRWSEEYQAQLLHRACRAAMDDANRLCGFTVWQFCDCRTSTEPRMMMGRPRGFNNKGIVDEHRIPKQAYDTLRREFLALAASEPSP